MLVVATTNPHKLDEIHAILAQAGLPGVEVVGLDRWPDLPEPPEDGDTFQANALQKARFVHQRLGLPVVADDSGLEVDALGGAPGVRSKRYTPQATADSNNTRLLRELLGVEDRSARFRCVLALVTDRGEATADGSCEGCITSSPRGAGGFGYDPLFEPRDHPGRTLAELSPDQKNAISHRGRAFRQLPALWARLG
ncbi:RdgB/HAM1 family non-canonical purine NTP pyrophosphatase [Myxococcota bacterium]|nr:RdgB/HAM1 family non-canonical purine NTP pyrophosphatase [Myxococcota bacterium]